MIANTRVAILRGSTTDALGDEIDDNQIATEGEAWTETRRNLVPNPTAANALTSWAAATYTLTRESDGLDDFSTYVKGVRLNGNAGAIRTVLGLSMPSNTESFSLRALVSSSAPIPNFQILARPNVNTGTGQALLSQFNLPSGTTLVELSNVTTFTGPANAASGVAFLALLGSGGLGDVLRITGVDLERASSIPDYLDGDGGNSSTERRRWLGEANASASVLEVASVTRVLDDIAASITETSRSVFDPSSGEWRTVRYYKGRLPADTPLAAGDRIRDNRTGKIYTIEEDERTPRSISGRSSLSLDLKLTGE